MGHLLLPVDYKAWFLLGMRDYIKQQLHVHGTAARKHTI